MTKKKGLNAFAVDRGHLYTNRQYAHPFVSILLGTERKSAGVLPIHYFCIYTHIHYCTCNHNHNRSSDP
jgi:hypothetical protein